MAEAVREGGEEQEAAGADGIAPGAGDTHVGEAAGGADYDGWRRGRGAAGLAWWPAQEEFEELFFDGGLEAADEGDGVGAQGAGKVVAFEDEVAGALDGAEEGSEFAVEEGGVADEGDGGRSCGVSAGAEGRGRERRIGLVSCDLQGKDPGSGWGDYAVTVPRTERFRLPALLRRLEQFDVGDLSLRSRGVSIGG